MGPVHFELSQAELRRKYASNGDFRPAALCGNGSAHATLSRDTSKITCPECSARIVAHIERLKT